MNNPGGDLSYEQSMAQLLNQMNAINTFAPVVSAIEVQESTPLFSTPNGGPMEAWHQAFSFSKSTSSEFNAHPTIIVDEVIEKKVDENAASHEELIQFLEDDVFSEITSSLLDDVKELDFPTVTIESEIFITSQPEEQPTDEEPDTPSTFLTIEKPRHTRRNSFSNYENIVHSPLPERPKSPGAFKRTRRNSFSDLEELEARDAQSEFDGIKKFRLADNFMSTMAEKKREQSPQLQISSPYDEFDPTKSQNIEIRMQPVLMMGDVPVQVLNTRSLSPMMPNDPNMQLGIPDPMYYQSPGSPGDVFSFPQFQFGGGAPPQKTLVPVKRRNSKPSPADQYMGQFLMKQKR
jgi:hypothetical protein